MISHQLQDTYSHLRALAHDVQQVTPWSVEVQYPSVAFLEKFLDMVEEKRARDRYAGNLVHVRLLRPKTTTRRQVERMRALDVTVEVSVEDLAQLPNLVFCGAPLVVPAGLDGTATNHLLDGMRATLEDVLADRRPVRLHSDDALHIIQGLRGEPVSRDEVELTVTELSADELGRFLRTLHHVRDAAAYALAG